MRDIYKAAGLLAGSACVVIGFTLMFGVAGFFLGCGMCFIMLASD